MKMWKKITAAALSALIALAVAVPVLAADERTKIEKVYLSFSSNDDSDEYGDVEVSADDSNYTVEDVEFLTSASSTGYPRVKVTLYADDDCCFASANKNLFSLSGEGATYSSSALRDNRSAVVVTVLLKKYSGAVANIPESVDWDYEGGGSWEAVPNAAYYEVQLKRGATVIGGIKKVDDTSFDFSDMITQTGRYTFQVRTVNQYVTSNVSKWITSERWYIDEDLLSQINARAANGVTNHYYSGNSGASCTNTGNSGNVSSPLSPAGSPGSAGPVGAVTGWQRDAVGYWYRNYDGTWPFSCWLQVSGYWYYFNASGYMVANQWIYHTDGHWYYLGANGVMLTNTRTPDNYYVDANGVYIPGI